MEVPGESFHWSSWDSRTCYPRRAFIQGLTDDCLVLFISWQKTGDSQGERTRLTLGRMMFLGQEMWTGDRRKEKIIACSLAMAVDKILNSFLLDSVLVSHKINPTERKGTTITFASFTFLFLVYISNKMVTPNNIFSKTKETRSWACLFPNLSLVWAQDCLTSCSFLWFRIGFNLWLVLFHLVSKGWRLVKGNGFLAY